VMKCSIGRSVPAAEVDSVWHDAERREISILPEMRGG